MDNPQISVKKQQEILKFLKTHHVREWLLTLISVIIFLGVVSITPLVFYYGVHVLSPVGFWQVLVTCIIGFYAFFFEIAVLGLSAVAIVRVLTQCIW